MNDYRLTDRTFSNVAYPNEAKPKRRNHIDTLTMQRDDARATIDDTRIQLNAILAYLASAKFQGVDNDYVHVSTDIYPKLMALRTTLCT